MAGQRRSGPEAHMDSIGGGESWKEGVAEVREWEEEMGNPTNFPHPLLPTSAPPDMHTVLICTLIRTLSAAIWRVGAFAAPLGLFCGRIANFINGELYGRGPTDVPWAVKFPQEIQHWSSKQLEQLNPIFAHAPQATTYDDLVKAVQTGNAQVAAQLAPLLTARHPSPKRAPKVVAAALASLHPRLYVAW